MSKAVYSFFDPVEINDNMNSSNDALSSEDIMSAISGINQQANTEYSSEVINRHNGRELDMDEDALSRTSRSSAATERVANKTTFQEGGLASSTSNMSNLSSNSGAENGKTEGNSGTSSTNSQLNHEANYEEGASELFLLVEGAAWQEAITRVSQFPEEAKVWINSSGTENTVFSWSVWRRLPLHEACRRQPPPALIYALLTAYPESAMAESHFGELPLHAAVRCGACAEVVNCLIAAYPAAAFARDNSGCTPLDILNGTGKMMDHDAVVAALTRTITVLTREEREWESKIKSIDREFRTDKERCRKDFERVVALKDAKIEDLNRELEQEKLATSNLAKKVIQTEKVVELKSSLELRYQEKLKKCEEDIKILKTNNAQRKSKIKELEDVIRYDKRTIEELNIRVQQLQAQLTTLCDEEETFVATTLAQANADWKELMESQLAFMKEVEKKKEQLRTRLGKLGIALPAKKFPTVEKGRRISNDTGKGKSELVEEFPLVDEPSDIEVAEKAMAAAKAQLPSSVENED